jgi:hypothetical protein
MGIVQDAIVRKRKEVQPPAYEATAHLPSPPPAKSLNEEYTEALERHNEKVQRMINKLNGKC